MTRQQKARLTLTLPDRGSLETLANLLVAGGAG
jgi:hypothetical protein